MGSRGLVRAALGSCTSNDDENVEDDTGHCHTKDDKCDSDMDSPEVAGEGTTEKQQCALQHQRQRLHHMVKVPGNDTIEFPLSVLAALDSGSTYVG